MNWKFLKEIICEPADYVGEPLQTVRLPGGRRELTQDFIVNVGNRYIKVETGFNTDFSSIPRMLIIGILFAIALLCTFVEKASVQEYLTNTLSESSMVMLSNFCEFSPFLVALMFLIPNYSKVDMAGAVHDYLYRYRYAINGKELTRQEIDLIWLKLAISGKYKANIIQAIPCWFIGLRLGAIFAWLGYRKNRKEHEAKTYTHPIDNAKAT